MTDDPFTPAILSWWRGTQDQRSASAELRRCHSLTDVMLTRAFQSLRVLGLEASSEQLAAIAWALGAVRTNRSERTVGEHFAHYLSDLRFRRLVENGEREPLVRQLIRVIQMTERSAPVEALARDLRFWGDATRRRWTFDFYDHFKEERAS